jgi:hypothetical protein
MIKHSGLESIGEGSNCCYFRVLSWLLSVGTGESHGTLSQNGWCSG